MREVIERLNGQGQVFLGERPVATASYFITVQQEFIDTSTFEGRSRVAGMQSAGGQMQVIVGPKDLELAQEWTLVLSDGRRCRCFLADPSLPSGTYTFTVSGAIA